MKIKCIQLLDSDGQEVAHSPWLDLGRTYHVMAMHVAPSGKRFFSIVSSQPDGEWPQMGNYQADCFEVVSDVLPSNWRDWFNENSSGTSPAAWQKPGFYEAFYDHEPAAYSIFDRERTVILKEDP